ncbi:MAG TPA: DinB family protein [Pyrinomonadaceae bacterium]|nr:DinB family protein [Pyrinomonadaceae bacterium]
MQKEILQNILTQNQMTCSFTFNKLTAENAAFRLTEQSASAGFYYRHVGEIIYLLATFLGVSTDVQNTTMGETDTGQGKDIDASKKLIEKGFAMLEKLIEETPESDWLETIETPFFGTISRIRLFSHILFHNSNHTGQISLILAKGRKM